MSLDMQTLIGKLNPICRRNLEAAAQFCAGQTHFAVEVEHFLVRLLEDPRTDARKLVKYYNLRPSDLRRELARTLEGMSRGNTLTPVLSPHVILLLEQAYLISSLLLKVETIRSGSVLVALLDHDGLRNLILRSAPSFRRIPLDGLKREIRDVLGRAEEGQGGEEEGGSASSSTLFPGMGSKTPALDLYTVDLTEEAKAGRIDPIVGRDLEIRQIIDVLTRRRQNNPILTGEAGVGKTAVAEGFALRVAQGDVPPALVGISLRVLDLGLLQAGAGIQGEFEKRVKSVIEEIRASPQPIILFIDEAHNLIGAGGPPGMSDAANLLKPALARGELRTIAATTWLEYKKYFEKDAALARRFQVIRVEEPDGPSAVRMLRAVAGELERHHKVTVLEEALEAAVRLSTRYITGRRLPEKAVSVLDTASARVAIRQSVTPPEIEDLTRRLERLDREIESVDREIRAGFDHAARRVELAGQRTETRVEKTTLEIRWHQEREAVEQLLKLQASLEELAQGESANPVDLDRLGRELTQRRAELVSFQQGRAMVPICVDRRAVAAVVSDWTGVPVSRMLSNELETILDLENRLAERIKGQESAVAVIARRIMTYRADLGDPSRPVGVFLLAGPGGVGKTETAYALAEALYGGERGLVVVNMAEYQEAYSVSGLKGAPPGYVGYGRGGILTEAVRRNPYTAVLLDEAEKAHPDVLELFEQVFDKGTIEDSEGLVVDFRNTLILLTTSLGAQTILDAVNGQETPPDPDRLKDQIRPDLLTRFRPSFLSRLVVVPYLPLGDEDVRRVAALKLEKIRRRFLEHQGVQMTWDDGLVTTLAGLSREVDAGARGLDSILAQVILPDLSAELLSRRASGRPCQSVHVRVRPDGRYRYRFDPPTPKAFLPLPLLDPFLPPEEPPAFEEDEEDEPEPVVEPASVEEPPAQPCEPEEVTEAEEPPADQAPVPEPEPEPDEFPPVRPDREEKEGFWRWLWSLFR